MKLSDYALSVLKNFSTINDGIVLRPGSIIRTVSDDEGILAEADVEDVFPSEYGIHDLNNFLGNISTLNQPDLEFDGLNVTLSDGVFKLSYRGYASDLIKSPPADKTVRLSNPDVTFDLPKETLAKLLKLAAMNGLSHLNVVAKSGTLYIQTHDRDNPDSNVVSTPVGAVVSEDFTSTFRVDNLKMLPDDYVVDLKKGAFARFTSKTRRLVYFISMEMDKK